MSEDRIYSQQLEMCKLCYKHGGEAKLRAKCLEILNSRPDCPDSIKDALAESMVRRVVNDSE